MSQTSTQFYLTFQPGTNPKHLGMTILVNNANYQNHPQAILTESGQITTANLLYTTTVDMAGIQDDPVVLVIDLGQLPLHQQDGEIDMTLVDGSNHIGNVRVKVKDAQDESRPLKFDS